jgi:hypothetical protein
VTSQVNFHFCQIKDENMPLAITRYTAYDDEDKVLAVEQVTYENDTDYLETEVSAALQCGVDVSILTQEPLTNFPFLEKLVTRGRSQ